MTENNKPSFAEGIQILTQLYATELEHVALRTIEVAMKNNLDLVLQDALVRPDDWVLASSIGSVIAKKLEQNQELEPSEHEWLIRGLRRLPIQGKKPRGRPSREHSLLDFIAVLTLVSLGFSPTRNDTSEKISACDVAAEAKRRLGLTPNSYSSLKAIWFWGKRTTTVKWPEKW